MVFAVTFLASDYTLTFELFATWLRWIPGGFMGAETKPASLSLIPLDQTSCFGDCTTQLSSTLNFEGRKPLRQHFQREAPLSSNLRLAKSSQSTVSPTFSACASCASPILMNTDLMCCAWDIKIALRFG